MNGGPPSMAPPPPYFDDEDMIDDYIDDRDEDFGGPPPPPPTTTTATNEATATNASNSQSQRNGNSNDNDDDNYYDNGDEEEGYWEEMMEIERQRQQQQQQQGGGGEGIGSTTTATTIANASTFDTAFPASTCASVAATDAPTNNASVNDIENRNEEETGNNDNNNSNSTVEEYLAARRQENNLYHFERYKKNKDWRTTTTTGTAIGESNEQQLLQQQQSRRRQRLFASSLLSNKNKTNSSFSKTVAPEARLLRLLEANRSGCGGNGNHRQQQQHKLRIQQRSSSSNGRRNIFRSPPKNDGNNLLSTVPMTLADGNRVYVRCSRSNNSSDSSRNTSNSNSNTHSATTNSNSKKSFVLGVGMKELFRRVDGMKRRSIALARNRAERATLTDGNSNSNTNDWDDMLWVDKHAPKSFPHLLSDERTNREVLRALRGWDPYVFGKAPPLRPLYQRQREEQQKQNDSNNNSKSKTDTKKDNQNPSDKRPEENARVILLSGPPGVGKTTLAHIVARHAGYRPVEVNASDERSSGVLKDRIQRAMESATINFKPGRNSEKNAAKNDPKYSRRNNTADYGRPNCLILDEIDGADARGSIQALVDIVKAEIPSKTNKQLTATTYLRRPIICICNHKYAPALRSLLPYAAHFNVEPPSSARLVARLKAILNQEKMSMMGVGPLLHQLVVSSGGDIRSSLFTLQFATAESKDSNDLSQALANSLSGTGLKDDRNDITSTISTVFRKTKPKASQFSSSKLIVASSRDKENRASVSRVMDAVDGLGDDSAAVNALFLNIPRVSYIDPAFDRCAAAHELLSFAVNAQQQHSGYAIPVVTASIHLLCRVEVKPDLTFSSRELADMKYRRESNLGLVQKFSEGLPPNAKNLKCNNLLSEEFIPLAVWVLSAGDGAASLSRAASSIDILTNKEQEATRKHVAALCALGLTYVVDREKEENNSNGSTFRAAASEMRMEPPIHRLVEYGSLHYPNGVSRNEIPSQMKELLAHQVVLDGFRNRESKPPPVNKAQDTSAETNKTPVMNRKKTTDENDNENQFASPAKITPRKLNQVSPSSSLTATKHAKSTPSPTAGNFLGIAARKGRAAKSARRAAALGLNRSLSKKQKLAHTGSGFLLSHVVRMKYVKGFTQAVRTPCRLNDLE